MNSISDISKITNIENYRKTLNENGIYKKLEDEKQAERLFLEWSLLYLKNEIPAHFLSFIAGEILYKIHKPTQLKSFEFENILSNVSELEYSMNYIQYKQKRDTIEIQLQRYIENTGQQYLHNNAYLSQSL